MNHPLKQEVLQERDLLSTIFTKLCFSETDNEGSEIVDTSEIIPVKEFDFFKRGSRLVPENDNRFHYEDDILEPEPLDTPEKNMSSYRIQRVRDDSDNSEEDIQQDEQ